jgi:transposase
MPEQQIQRPVARIDTQPQMMLFGEPLAPVEPACVPSPSRKARFDEKDPHEIYIGPKRLDAHLQAMGLTDAFVVRHVLGACDWSVFEAHYQDNGRPAYAPRAMAGIVMYGVVRGVSSLRDLERFARADLGCMWVSGGITPDHSVLGRFIQRHEVELSQALFADVVRQALRRTGSGRASLAGDGTTLEAMSSRFALVKREAMQVLCEQAQDEEKRAQAETAAQVLAEREHAKAIVPAEPEAGLLRLKNGRGSRPAYEAVVTANAARVVVDAQVHSSSELAAMKALLGRMDGSETRELLLDAGFSNDFALIEETVAKEISLLSPEQAETPREGAAPTRIPLREFCYDEAGDFYVCPQGHRLLAGRRYAGSRPGERKQRRPYVQYVASASDCGGCPRRSECTRGAQRTLQRDEAQALKEGLRQVMAQPAAKRRFAYRKAMVESVFSQLRGRQGLHRFRRRGLRGVRLEFRIHLMAYNLSRVVAYVRRGIAKAFFGLIRAPWGLWRALARLAGKRWAQTRGQPHRVARTSCGNLVASTCA